MNHLSIICIIFILTAGCNSKEKGNISNEIAVSILPQKYFVSKITGDKFKINVMIPPGASPASYEPTPVQLTSLSHTNLYLKIGFTGFELAWMEKLSAANENMKIADLSSGIDLIMENSVNEQHEIELGHHHGGVDPHIWLSPRNVKIICENIYRALNLSLTWTPFKKIWTVWISILQKN
jgi:zinc transport system substrate-binding protein